MQEANNVVDILASCGKTWDSPSLVGDINLYFLCRPMFMLYILLPQLDGRVLIYEHYIDGDIQNEIIKTLINKLM